MRCSSRTLKLQCFGCLRPGDLRKAVRSRNKNPAPPRLQVPSAFASDLSVCDATGWGDLQGAMEGSKLPIHQLFDHITEAVSRHFSLLQMLSSFSYPSLLFSSTSQFVFYF
jgi:hypothetical protein